jgi:pilus assembly protein CpaE
MSAPLRVIVAVDGGTEQRTLESVLDDPGLEVVGTVENHGDLRGREDLNADAMLVACNGHSDVALAYVAEATRERPEWPVVVASAGAANGFVREVFKAGADDIVLLADTATPGADTFFALQKAIVRRQGPVGESSAGTLITVLGPKGGTGKTLTTANLSCALADSGHRVVGVDLDLQFGDLGLTLGLNPERTIYDLATSGGNLDADKIDAYLTDHPTGLRTLVAPVRPDQAQSVTPDFLRELYPVLLEEFEFVVVDTPPGFTPEVIVTIDAAAAVCMVGMLDAPSLKNTKLGLETLDLMGVPSERVRVLLNRADSNVGITHADVMRILGRAPDALVPSQRDVVRSVNRGEPIVLSAKRSDPAKAFRAMAEQYASERVKPGEHGKRRGRRILGRS